MLRIRQRAIMRLSEALPRELQSRYNYGNRNPKPVEYFMPMARKEIWDNNEIIYRPVDRRDNYVKRCVGLPGDTITIKSGDSLCKRQDLPGSEGTADNILCVVPTEQRSIRKHLKGLIFQKADQSMTFEFSLLSSSYKDKMLKRFQSSPMLKKCQIYL